ncbi:MAG: hypothetical protein UX89_C0004G0019 [Parcubacteria group bacterium GW2011_GWA2_47_16]|nr:MAG: hypothetical protein UX89_C0004G0019 [Parcubacteria group bacterium GW2011_GWA2_47_16]
MMQKNNSDQRLREISEVRPHQSGQLTPKTLDAPQLKPGDKLHFLGLPGPIVVPENDEGE